MVAEHHTLTQELVGGVGTFLTGGVGFRYMRIAVQTMPIPLPGSRWYNWFYNFTQQAMDNTHLLPAPAGTTEGGGPR